MISLNLKILQSWRSYQSIFYLLDFKLVQSSYFYCLEFFDKVVTKFQIQLEVISEGVRTPPAVNSWMEKHDKDRSELRPCNWLKTKSKAYLTLLKVQFEEK